MLHGLETLAGHGFVFDGLRHQGHLVQYTRRDDCPALNPNEPLKVLPGRVAGAHAGDSLERVRSDLGPGSVVETNQDLLRSLWCGSCRSEETMLGSLGKLTEGQGRCPDCGAHRAPRIFHTIEEHDSSVLDRTLDQLGVLPWEILGGGVGWIRSTGPGRQGRGPGPDGPDVRQLADQALPEAPFPGGRGLVFRAHIATGVHPTLWSHATEQTSGEIRGALVGH